MVEKNIKVYATKGCDWQVKSDFKKSILDDFGYNWRTIKNVSLDYDVRDNMADIYIDFKKNFVLEIKYDDTTEKYTVKSFELNSVKELEDYIKKLPLYEYDDTLQKFKIYKESLKGYSGKKILRDGLEIKEGDILNSNWGYDQTNIEFFKVLRVLGKNYFIIQEIGGKYEETGFMCGNTNAGDEFLKHSMPRKAFTNKNGCTVVSETGYRRSLGLTNKKETHYTSSYA